MTRILRVLAAILSLVVLPACETTTVHVVSPSEPVLPEADALVEVQRLLDDIMAADHAGDVERAVSFYTENAILLPPTSPEVVGREAIRAHYVGAFGRFKLNLTATVLEARTCGHWGVARGTVQGTLAEKPEGANRDVHDKFVGIIDRGADGTWRFARLMWSPVAQKEG